MVYLVREMRDRGVRPDFALLGAMIYYIDTFPERLHHPKEDRYLFRLLRMRCAAAAKLLDRLEEEHRTGAGKIRALEQSLARFQQGGIKEFAAFADAVDAYADFHWEHMRSEENEVLPLAEKHLTVGDWEAIDAAFTDHRDPLFGSAAGQAYEELFRRIVNLAPPPIGVGPVR
jgi:hemerythrin-like domain-containing protein